MTSLFVAGAVWTVLGFAALCFIAWTKPGWRWMHDYDAATDYANVPVWARIVTFVLLPGFTLLALGMWVTNTISSDEAWFGIKDGFKITFRGVGSADRYR